MHRLFIILLLVATAACERMSAATPDPSEAAPVDTLAGPTPRIEAALAGFRADLGDPPLELGGAYADRREQLVRRFVQALESSDTAAFLPMMVTRAEYGWLYYPHTMYARPPYEMEPDVMWFLLAQNAEKGIGRALREYGGRPLHYAGHACNPTPRQEGENRLWEGCVLTLDGGNGSETTRLFGGILERAGRFKFLSYANDL